MQRKAPARRLTTAASLAALTGLWCADAHAGSHKNQVAQMVPVYLQQAPVAPVYAAPAAQVFSAPTAPVYAAPAAPVYSAPAAQVYSAPAAQVFSAPVAPVYSAPATQVYSAPAYYATSSAAGGTTFVGNAPVIGAKISAVDREDILSELRKEAKEGASGTSMRERRKALREAARTKYAEALDVEDSELSDADVQDLEIVVNSVLSPHTNSAISTVAVQSAPVPVASYAPAVASYAPAFAPQQPAAIVQPVVPVQLFVPVKPKHNFFHKY